MKYVGKALGGASGGYTAASKEVVDLLRQRSRPYLFSNTLAPVIAGASVKVLDMLMSSTDKVLCFNQLCEGNLDVFSAFIL